MWLRKVFAVFQATFPLVNKHGKNKHAVDQDDVANSKWRLRLAYFRLLYS